MKRIRLILIGLTFACAAFAQNAKNYAEVIYFHGSKRCITCNAIEKHTKDLIESEYSNDIKEGALIFKIVDISKKENAKIAAKYKVVFSSLFVNAHQGEKEKSDNLTKFAFSTARFKPEEFKAGLKKKIDESLKAAK